MFLVLMPLTVPAREGDLLVIFDPLSYFSFNARGFLLASHISLKAIAVALMMEPLFGTAPFPVTIQALSRLKVPQSVCQMVLLAHRYIFSFQHEVKRMLVGMRIRGFRKKNDLETLRTTGNFLGMLFVRSFERTQRVYDAMLCRGYNGTFPSFATFSAPKKDWIKGVFWLFLGIALLSADRLWHPSGWFFTPL